MDLAMLRHGFNYSQDGQGNRMVIHLQGCNLHCPWCSNPEGISLQGTIMESNLPIPSHICPFGGVDKGRLNRAICSTCQDRPCLTHPDSVGVKLSCHRVTLEALLAECEQARPLYFDKGGVTLSGGEPTLQFDAVKALLQGLHHLAINTAMETNGFHPLLSELFTTVDQLIIDCKHTDAAKHSSVTGDNNQRTLQNLALAFAQHPNLLVRTPLVHGFNDDDAALEGFLDFYRHQDTRHANFEFLRYHELGVIKWKQCGMDYTMHNADVPEETRLKFEGAFRANGYKVVRT